ncbi:MAG: O-antigen ligase family protein [Parcubacteria group bacterium]|nr:O-antigen ligase family protein [Parcubacteria group bacterium]
MNSQIGTFKLQTPATIAFPFWVLMTTLGAGFLLLAASVLASSWFLFGLLLAISYMLLAWYRLDLALTVLTLTLLLEHNSYLLPISSLRVRIHQVLLLILMAVLLIQKRGLRIDTHLKPFVLGVLGYLGINALSILVSPARGTSITIFILLLLLALLTWVLVAIIRTERDLQLIWNALLFVGAIEVFVGLWQVVGAYLITQGTFLFHGEVFHSDIIPYGRPYGTFVEPDWFGAFTMLYLFLLVPSFIFARNWFARIAIAGMAVLTLIANFLSAVRASWIGLAVAVPFLLVLLARRLRFNLIAVIMAGLLGLLGTFGFLSLVSPSLGHAVVSRVTTLFDERTVSDSPRLITSQDAWENFLTRPIFGNGVGSYKVLGVVPFVSVWEAGEAFIPSLPVTILHDTGIVGFIIFVITAILFIQYLARAFRRTTDARSFVILASLASGLLALFFSYIFTTGFWIAFTWFVVGLTIAQARLILKSHSSS